MGLVDLPAKPINCRNLVAGEWQTVSGNARAVTSPYSGEAIGQVTDTDATTVGAAMAAAQEGFHIWRQMPIKERCQYLFRFREEMLASIDSISNLAAAECGKTVGEAKAGVLKGLEVCEYALSLQNLDQGGAMEVSRGVTCEYRREPLGVVVGIAPFNFPAMVPLWMYPIAIALGNAFVLKPSDKVPLTSQLVGDCVRRAGFPAGVFSIVNGGKNTTEALIDHPLTKAVAFVGSTPVAKAVYQRATTLGKRALALGGAKNHLLLVPDADPKMAIDGIVSSFTGCAGQRCMAASLLIAVGNVDTMLDAVIERAKSIKLGSEMGALIDQEALNRIQGILDRVPGEGGKILLDGRGVEPPSPFQGGHWMAPSIIEAKPGSEAARCEIFGPIVTIIRVKTLAEAMQLEAESNFGNATSVFTTSGAVANYVASRATNGMIGVNVGVPVPREPFSFGGTKESKFGHGDITGDSSLDFWSDRKKITTKWSLQPDHNWMS